MCQICHDKKPYNGLTEQGTFTLMNCPVCTPPADPHQPKVDALAAWMDDLTSRSAAASVSATAAGSPQDHLIEQMSYLTEAVLLLARVLLFGMAEVHGKENGR